MLELSLGSCLKLAFDSKARCDRYFLTGDLTTVSESCWVLVLGDSWMIHCSFKDVCVAFWEFMLGSYTSVTVNVCGVTVLIRPVFSFLLGALLWLALSPQEDGLGVWRRDAAFFCGTWAFSPCPLAFSCYPANCNKWCWTKERWRILSLFQRTYLQLDFKQMQRH